MPDETDEQISRRHQSLLQELDKQVKARNNCRNHLTRDKKTRICESLRFTIRGVEAEMRDRGLDPDAFQLRMP